MTGASAGPRIEGLRLGREGQPLAVIDDFAPDPGALRAAAIAADYGPAGRYYPGVRARLPDDYLPAQLPVIAAALADLFGETGAIEVIDASFSIVATPAEALTVAQRLPHCDAFDSERIAMIHYLSDDPAGTAFYRHRSTGFETIDQHRRPIYFGQVEAELRHGGPPPAGYVSDNAPFYDRIAAVEARYNRALVYRSFQLHSGAVSAATPLCADPARGRLTVTGFLTLRRA